MHLYRELLPQNDIPFATKIKRDFSKLSMDYMSLRTNRQYPDVAHHTIWMGQRYKDLLDDIFHRQTLADDFSCMYIGRPQPIRHLHRADMIAFTS